MFDIFDLMSIIDFITQKLVCLILFSDMTPKNDCAQLLKEVRMQVGFSSPAQSGIVNDLGLSIAEVISAALLSMR